MMGISTAEKQRTYKARQRALGLVQVTDWVPSTAAADFREVSAFLRGHPTYTFGQMRDSLTGKQYSWRKRSPALPVTQ